MHASAHTQSHTQFAPPPYISILLPGRKPRVVRAGRGHDQETNASTLDIQPRGGCGNPLAATCITVQRSATGAAQAPLPTSQKKDEGCLGDGGELRRRASLQEHAKSITSRQICRAGDWMVVGDSWQMLDVGRIWKMRDRAARGWIDCWNLLEGVGGHWWSQRAGGKRMLTQKKTLTNKHYYGLLVISIVA